MVKGFGKALAAVLFGAMMTGCASQGGLQGTLEKARVVAGDVATTAVGVAKDVGGNLIPEAYTTGTKITADTLAQIQPGDSMADVEALIGPAPQITASGNGEVWSYMYVEIPTYGQNIRETTVVRFDKNNKVSRAYKTQGGNGQSTGNPLLDAASAKGYL